MLKKLLTALTHKAKKTNRKCIDCPFFVAQPSNSCFLVYMNQQDAPHGNGSIFCKYSDKDFLRFSRKTTELRGGYTLPSSVRNKITRIQTPAQFAIHAHSLTKNYTPLGGGLYSAKPLCPICAGSRICDAESLVSTLSSPLKTDCPVCGGSGIIVGDNFSKWFFLSGGKIDFTIALLCHQDAFKTPLDAPKFLPMVI